jgi:hypothetical protein
MLHSLKPKIDCEVPTATLAPELLDVTVIVVANPVFHDLWRLAVEASVNIYRLNNDRLWLNDLSESEAELDSPNVLALDITVHVIWTGALPTASILGMNGVEPSARLRLDEVVELIYSLNLVRCCSNLLAAKFSCLSHAP